jgi:hypothetical protein
MSRLFARHLKPLGNFNRGDLGWRVFGRANTGQSFWAMPFLGDLPCLSSRKPGWKLSLTAVP